MDSISRVNKAVVHGGLFIAGDNFANVTLANTSREFLGNSVINNIMSLGRPFRPIFTIENDFIAPHIFELDAGNIDNHRGVYIAAFNYAPYKRAFKYKLSATTIPSSSSTITAVNVWSGLKYSTITDGYLTITVEPRTSLLLFYSSNNEKYIGDSSSVPSVIIM